MLIIFVPILGVVFYFSFGINYRKNKLYSKKLKFDKAFSEKIKNEISEEKIKNLYPKNDEIFIKFKKIIHLFAYKKSENAWVLPN